MAKAKRSILAWHFVGATLRDGRPVPADGEKLIFPGTPEMCIRGLHASRDPYDALRYAPGTVLCRVRCGGVILEQDDKLVCTERTILARADAAEGLRYFARMQALSVLHLFPGDPVPEVLDWLMGDDDARSAAWSAAGSAAWSAAESAGWSAARSAARSAAWSAARKEWNAIVRGAFQ